MQHTVTEKIAVLERFVDKQKRYIERQGYGWARKEEEEYDLAVLREIVDEYRAERVRENGY